MMSQDAEAQRYVEEICAKPELVDANTFTKHFMSTPNKYRVWQTYKGTKIGSHTIEELYLDYIRNRFLLRREAHAQDYAAALGSKNAIAFNSPAKQRELLTKGYIDRGYQRITQRFPLKQLTRKFALHHVAAPNSWIVDVVFFGEFAYYVFININTRFLYAIPANARIDRDRHGAVEGAGQIIATPKESTGTDYYAEALREFLPRHPHASLRGDAEGAFTTSDPRIQSLYNRYGASFLRIGRLQLNTRRRQKSAPYHSALAVIDAVVRTLRSMAYNLELDGDVNPFDMREIVRQYNEAPHSTLTRFGPGFPITPAMAQKDAELEAYICRAIAQENMEVRRQQGFDLPPGTPCLVYNDISPLGKRRSSTRPEIFVVVSFERGKYQMRGDVSGTVLWLPRFKISPIKKEFGP
jgi:hypothetical protein